jgi:hypothetical protein
MSSSFNWGIGVLVSLLNFRIPSVFSKCPGLNPFDSIAPIALIEHIGVSGYNVHEAAIAQSV